MKTLAENVLSLWKFMFMKIFKHFFIIIFQEWPLITLGMIGLVGSSAATMASPLFFGYVVDAATKNDMGTV